MSRSLVFAELAPVLAELDYETTAIRPGGKGPTLADWQRGLAVDRYLAAGMARWGVGILCRTTPAIDIDIRCRELVHLMVRLIDDVIGGAPVRFGHPPKALLPFTCEEPYRKRFTRWYSLPGDNWRTKGYGANRLEVLADGQQFVAYAVHPDTGRPYRWARGGLFTQHRIDLPYLEKADADRLIGHAERVFESFGCLALARDPATKLWLPWAEWQEQQERRLREWRENRQWRQPVPGGDADLDALPLGELAKRIDPKAYPSGASWRLRCPVHQGKSHSSLKLDRKDGRTLWFCFGGCDALAVGAALRERVR